MAFEYNSPFLPKPAIVASLQSRGAAEPQSRNQALLQTRLTQTSHPRLIAEGSQNNSSHDDHAEDQGVEQSFPFVFTCAIAMSQATVTSARCCLLTVSCLAGH